MNRGRDIIPSHFGLSETPSYDDGGAFDNAQLRFGEVQKVLYPDNEANRSKKFVEYNVFVQHRDGHVGVGTMYTNCLIASMFGGAADIFTYSLRVPETPSTEDKKAKGGLGLGSKVLILCLNGERNSAYIVGGKRDPERDDFDKNAKDLKQYLIWRFNGITAFINKDGELDITYGGKTDIDGSTNSDVKDEVKNSRVQFKKNGDINLLTGDGKQVVKLDNENGKVIIKRDKNLEIGDATDEMLLGKSFRDAQKQKNNKIKGYAKAAKNFMQQAAIQLNTAGGAVAGPFLAATAGSNLIAASQLLQQAAAQFDQIAQALDDFEQAAGQRNSFLSKKNKSD